MNKRRNRQMMRIGTCVILAAFLAIPYVVGVYIWNLEFNSLLVGIISFPVGMLFGPGFIFKEFENGRYLLYHFIGYPILFFAIRLFWQSFRRLLSRKKKNAGQSLGKKDAPPE